MKKLPLAFSGCLLGLAGAGNLILDTFPLLSHVFSLSGLILWFYFLYSHLSDWQESKQELKKAPVLSGMATFPMAGMILSTYMLRILPVSLNFIAQVLWWFAFLLDVGLIIYFTINYVQAKPRTSATPSWTVLYVGIAVASLTYPVVGIVGIAYGAWIFGFILTLILYPLSSHLSRFERKSITTGFTRTRRYLLCTIFSTVGSTSSDRRSRPS